MPPKPQNKKFGLDFKGKPKKKQKQGRLTVTEGSHFVKVHHKAPLMIKKDILLTYEIYSDRIPEEMKDKQFHYKVTSYDDDTKLIKVRYQNRMIKKKTGLTWQ